MAPTPPPIGELTARWRSNPDAATTLALCDALRTASQPALVNEVGQVASVRYAADAAVMMAAARMYMAADRLGDAQTALVAAGKVAPRDPLVYRWLGEVLLRRGDAERAIKVLERAVQFGATDAETRLWVERARVFKPIQATGGMRAVAAEIARTAPVEGPRLPIDSMTDSSTTEVRVVPAPPLGRADEDEDDDRLTRPARRPAAGTPPPPPPHIPPAPANRGAPNALAISTRGRDDDEPSVTARFRADDEPGVLARLNEKPLYDKNARTGDAWPMAQTPPMAPPSSQSPPRDPFAGLNGPRKAASAVSPGPQPAAGRALSSPRPPPPPPPAPLAAPPPPARMDLNATRPRADEKLGGAPVALEPRDVLDALSLAGVFEPQGPATTAPVHWDRAEKRRRGPGSITLIVTLFFFLAASSGTFFYVKDKRAKERAQADALIAQVETTLDEGIATELAGAEGKLGRAFELDSRSPRAALVWLRERALLGLLKGGSEIAFEESIARAREVGVRESDVAFAHVASFLFQGDTVGAAALLPKWDGPAAGDAWYQLLAGATLDRAGDARATERYDAAAKIDSKLAAAQIRRVRTAAIDGDPVKAMEMARLLEASLPGRAEPIALIALAWARDPAHAETPPPQVDETIRRAAELPASLAAIPHALAALRAIDKRALAAAKDEIQQGLAAADGPGIASWLGAIALGTGDEQLARKAALAAVSFSAVYPPARVLAARVALLGARLDEALKATEELDANSPDVAVVRAAAAYERIDPDALARAIEAVAPEQRKLPFFAALALAPDVLAGRAAIPADKRASMADDDAPWSDLVAMDQALDAGDLEGATQIAGAWKGTEDHALRALRLARLARYEGKLDAADALSLKALASGTVTPRVLAERVFVLVARGKGNEAAPLLSKYPLVLGPMGTWLSAYVTASAGKLDDARGRTASLDPPPPLAPLPTRTIAAASLGAMRDRKRGTDVVKALVASGAVNPDVATAALALGFRRVDRGKRVTFVAP